MRLTATSGWHHDRAFKWYDNAGRCMELTLVVECKDNDDWQKFCRTWIHTNVFPKANPNATSTNCEDPAQRGPRLFTTTIQRSAWDEDQRSAGKYWFYTRGHYVALKLALRVKGGMMTMECLDCSFGAANRPGLFWKLTEQPALIVLNECGQVKAYNDVLGTRMVPNECPRTLGYSLTNVKRTSKAVEVDHPYKMFRLADKATVELEEKVTNTNSSTKVNGGLKSSSVTKTHTVEAGYTPPDATGGGFFKYVFEHSASSSTESNWSDEMSSSSSKENTYKLIIQGTGGLVEIRQARTITTVRITADVVLWDSLRNNVYYHDSVDYTVEKLGKGTFSVVKHPATSTTAPK
jgi:hypothetical protein